MNRHESLLHDPSNLVGGAWVPIPGAQLCSCNPAAPERVVWSGSPRVEHVGDAIAAARAAALPWAQLDQQERVRVLRAYQKLAAERVEPLTMLIRDEVGKPTWDARAEAQLIAGKVDITLEEGPHAAMTRVKGFELSLGGTKSGRCWYRPHGVMAVIGPFNFPAHLPNGHVVPALAMGNTVVFKPSDKAPAVGQFIAEMFAQALDACQAPAGVFNLVQGGAEVASTLCSHEGIDGVLFTGSWEVGRRIMQANLDRPGRILALEMGGNNAAIILDDADIEQAVTECVRCAFITAGQRCTCTRRVIVQRGVADRVIAEICRKTSALIIGEPAADSPVFMGPVISEQSRATIAGAFARMAQAPDARVLMAMRETGSKGWYLSPGIVLVDRFVPGAGAGLAGEDVEVFGPLLRISIVDSLEDGIAQCNATAFGLAASLFSQDESAFKQCMLRLHAGCINWNAGTAGASSKLPFGGLGQSGNHRPAGAFSLDYCACPIAGMIERSNACVKSPGMQ